MIYCLFVLLLVSIPVSKVKGMKVAFLNLDRGPPHIYVVYLAKGAHK